MGMAVSTNHKVAGQRVELSTAQASRVSGCEAPLQRVPCNPALQSLSMARRVLLLQGPLGPFFDRLTVWLQRCGAEVHRIVFQGGDQLDCQALQPIVYDQPLEQWAGFCRQTLQRIGADHLVLFGQARLHHAAAIAVAKTLGVRVVVMEEGYFRPGFATMELDGVNGYSTTMQRYEWSAVVPTGHPPPVVAGDAQPDDTAHHFRKMAWHASQHYLAIRKHARRFPHYAHHKEDNPYWYARYWVWSWVKKYWYEPGDQRLQAQLLGSSMPYFFVPLQHDGDAQITHHSTYNENTDFIFQVMRSFASHAPENTKLVFKQHPHSRGGAGHRQFIASLAQELGVAPRVLHMVGGDTPVLVQHSRGVVLINSTVGIQALQRGAPLIALGEALYRQPGLTHTEPLDHFWHHARPADAHVVRRFLAQIKNLTQVPVSLYDWRRAPLNWRLPT